MKAALLDTFQKDSLAFWNAFFRELDLEMVRPRNTDQEALDLGRESLPSEPRHVQFAVGRLIDFHMQGATVIVPRPAEVIGDKIDANPWLTEFPLVVNYRLSLPRPEQVLTYGEEEIQRTALTVGTQLTSNPQKVRLAWERHKPLLKTRRKDLVTDLAGYRSVAVIAPRYLLQQDIHVAPVLEMFKEYGLNPVLSSDLDRNEAMGRHSRIDVKVSTDIEQELAGALSLLDGKGFTQGVIFLVPERSDAHQKFVKDLVKKTRKPSLVLTLQDTPEIADAAQVRAFSERLGQYNEA
ncbi:hypothetical protein [Deinococcus cellulosilyticus]|uniref:Uncharacterized protein n=1 Tax=Deinococcus cellulosilyticus (strain DSM 18568 / NBRC 106333 / KACC 11606 / 5516J-15) TaxID=1223518 RepID=A0A511N224_DEIC1|nr:hypothetical protein [Deinococcus cellulosilyticus]GEM46557.1 hypothetical protein DC3_21920 [Deinococcus cellulosilyticus NBRC 106333 = KACC 11606]